MKYKISVVIPIYNVEKYLNKCVDSVINQTYSNIEIILVDDGSTDNSGSIADEFKRKDDRIRVFHKKNGGLSDARNYGIEKATGKYICFVDSDDFVEKDYIEFMFNNLVAKKVKVSACGYCYVFEKEENLEIKKINYDGIHKTFVKDEMQIYLNVIGYFNVSFCNKLFDIDLFEDIRFPVGKKSEDWFIMYKVLEKANSIYYDSTIKYYYRQRKGSITKNTKPNTDSIEAANNVYNHFINNKNVKKYAAQSLAFAIIGIYNFYLCKENNLKKRREYREELLDIYDELTYKKLSFSRKVQLFLFRYLIAFYNIIFKIFDKKRNI